jgi:hypothetical protein
LPHQLQLHIIKGSLLSRINNLPSSTAPDFDEETGHGICMVFTSNDPGLVAAKEIQPTTLVWLLQKRSSRQKNSLLFPSIQKNSVFFYKTFLIMSTNIMCTSGLIFWKNLTVTQRK